jgi:hypothetical protein
LHCLGTNLMQTLAGNQQVKTRKYIHDLIVLALPPPN